MSCGMAVSPVAFELLAGEPLHHTASIFATGVLLFDQRIVRVALGAQEHLLKRIGVERHASR